MSVGVGLRALTLVVVASNDLRRLLAEASTQDDLRELRCKLMTAEACMQRAVERVDYLLRSKEALLA